jgi:mannose-6-phosphate isomerase-like protein (cupin superfamily)
MTRRDAPGVIGPGQGRILKARGSVLAFKAVAAQTGGDFSLMERTVPAGGRRPPAHRHDNCSEGFFVLEGTLVIEVDEVEHQAGAGDFVLARRDVLHTFGNAGSEPARLLIIHAPAMDAYFEELHTLWSGPQPPSPEQERELMSRHGMRR